MKKEENVKPKIISIVGLTASGKSTVGIKLAQQFNGEIVSCDSRQVYKHLDLGSGKVTKEEQALAPHHLLDIVEPTEYFSVADFQKLAYKSIDDILKRNKLPILVGGSGLYSRSVVEGYNFTNNHKSINESEINENMPLEVLQQIARTKGLELNNSDFNNKRRLTRKLLLTSKSDENQELLNKRPNSPRYNVLQICLMPSKDDIEKLVVARIDSRLKDGMLDEAKWLLDNGYDGKFLQSLGLEYFWNIEVIKERISMDEYKKNLAEKTMQFVKRQRTWFAKEKNTIFLTEPKTFVQDCEKAIEKFLYI